MLNPCARESKAQTGRFLREKLISDHGLFSSYEGQQGAANYKIPRAFFKGLWTAFIDAGSRAGFTRSRPRPLWTSILFIYLFLHGV